MHANTSVLKSASCIPPHDLDGDAANVGGFKGFLQAAELIKDAAKGPDICLRPITLALQELIIPQHTILSTTYLTNPISVAYLNCIVITAGERN